MSNKIRRLAIVALFLACGATLTAAHENQIAAFVSRCCGAPHLYAQDPLAVLWPSPKNNLQPEPQGGAMTPAHFWPWQSWALLGLNLAAESAVLWLAVQRKFFNKMLMLPVFAGFCVVFDLGTIILGCTLHIEAASGQMWLSQPYWLFYWGGQIVSTVLVLLLAVQVIIVILPPWDRLIALLGILGVLAFAIIYAKLLPVKSPRDVLTVISWASAITILTLPIIWVVKPADWPKGISLIVAGLLLPLLLQAGCTVTAAALKTMTGFISYGIPCAALVGMGLFLVALLRLPAPRETQLVHRQ